MQNQCNAHAHATSPRSALSPRNREDACVLLLRCSGPLQGPAQIGCSRLDRAPLSETRGRGRAKACNIVCRAVRLQTCAGSAEEQRPKLLTTAHRDVISSSLLAASSPARRLPTRRALARSTASKPAPAGPPTTPQRPCVESAVSETPRRRRRCRACGPVSLPVRELAQIKNGPSDRRHNFVPALPIDCQQQRLGTPKSGPNGAAGMEACFARLTTRSARR